MHHSLVAFHVLALLAGLSAARLEERDSAAMKDVCRQIAAAVSSASSVHFPGTISYTKDISHWAPSSTDHAVCSVEPGTAADVGVILQIVGKTKTPFAVKGGGHATNPGWSSTPGVHIAMSRFSEVTYHEDSQTADIGTGLVWDDVYAGLAPHGVNVVGGRVPGVGVAGFSLGGGYSWLTNQHGLTVDNIISAEVVLPNGSVTTADSSNPDLLFAIKGGYNNFGIVTKLTLKTYPQGQVWGGLITYTEDQLSKVNAAVTRFSANVTDPKAAVISSYNFVLGAPGVSQLIFYDGPSPPAGTFDDFLAIPHFTKDVKTREFADLIKSFPASATAGSRAVFHTVSLLDYTPRLMDAIVNETKFLGPRLSLASATFLSYDVEPFVPSIFSKGTLDASAYPPERSRALLPLNIYFAWQFPASDELIREAAGQSAAQLTQVAVSEGQDIADAPLYGNYAKEDTPLERIFGANLGRLREIKQKVDPDNVMGLAGGWKI